MKLKLPFKEERTMKGLYACDKNDGFALYNELAIKSKTDMNGFKTRTSYSVVIMGYKTYMSMNRKPLETRINVVLYNRELSKFDENQNDFIFIKENDWERLLAIMVSFWNRDIFVIGGVHTFKVMEKFILTMYQCKFLIDSHATSKFELPKYYKEVILKEIKIDDVKITGEGNLLHQCDYKVTEFKFPKFGIQYQGIYEAYSFIFTCKSTQDKIKAYKKMINETVLTFYSDKSICSIENSIRVISFIQEIYSILKNFQIMKDIDDVTERAIKEIAFYAC